MEGGVGSPVELRQDPGLPLVGSQPLGLALLVVFVVVVGPQGEPLERQVGHVHQGVRGQDHLSVDGPEGWGGGG